MAKEPDVCAERLRTHLEEELRNAARQLRRAPAPPGAIHQARRSIKKLRAGLRLGQKALGKKRLAAVEQPLREAGRLLGPLRDAAVLRDTAGALRMPGEPPPRLPDGTARGAALALVRKARERVRRAGQGLKRLPWAEADAAALARGLRRLYRRGRRAMREADAERSDEALHAWRRRNKDLQYALPVMEAALPKGGSLAKGSARLSEFLGDDHDLAFFAAHSPDLRGKTLRQARRRRKELQEKAFRCGRRLYARRPKKLLKG